MLNVFAGQEFEWYLTTDATPLQVQLDLQEWMPASSKSTAVVDTIGAALIRALRQDTRAGRCRDIRPMQIIPERSVAAVENLVKKRSLALHSLL